MDALKVQIATVSINAMLKSNHFSICAVRDVATMMNIIPDKEAMDMLSPLHCIDYNKMTPEVVRAIPELIMKALGGGMQIHQFPQTTSYNIIDTNLDKAKSNEYQEFKMKNLLSFGRK